jgi:hypothetical protein
MEYETEGL